MSTLFISVNMNQTLSGEYHWFIEDPLLKYLIDEGYALSPEAAFIAAKEKHDAYLEQQQSHF